MNGSSVYPADGEKLSARQLHSTYVAHPGVDEYFRRGTLVIGTRGSGKTFLLRHRKHFRHEGAIYVNLLTCLGSMARDLGLGGRSLDYGEDQRAWVQSKTAALIILSVLEQLLKDRRSGAARAAQFINSLPLLPADLQVSGEPTLESVVALRLRTNRKRLESWGHHAPSVDYLAEGLTQINSVVDNGLTLFLDRAEDIPAPSLKAILPLLDQSIPFLTVIAARPGVAHLMADEVDPTFTPGDHFDVIHLGADPYEEDWTMFSRIAVQNHLAANSKETDDMQLLTWASRLARDSVRSAAQFAQIGLAYPDLTQRADRIYRLQSFQLATLKSELQPEHPNYAALIDRLRHRCRDELIQGPQKALCVRVIRKDLQLTLLNHRSALTDFLLKAIRCEALYLPPGEVWHPFSLPTTFEIPPLLVWNRENLTWIS